jgi:hypothetical protein
MLPCNLRCAAASTTKCLHSPIMSRFMMAALDRIRTRCACPHDRAGACASTSGKAARAAAADILSI